MNSSRNRKTPAQARGMSLVELLASAVITALVALTSAMLLNAVSNATGQSRDTRQVNSAGHYATARIGRSLRQARAVGQVVANEVSLWVADTNADDIINLGETALIYYDASAQAIACKQLSGISSSSTVVSAATFKDVTQLEQQLNAAGAGSVQWATNVQAFSFSGYPSLTSTRLISCQFTVGTGSTATDFLTTAAPKGEADYLFVTSAQVAPSGSETRVQRASVSPYSGL